MKQRVLACSLTAFAWIAAAAQSGSVTKITPQAVFNRYLQALGGKDAVQQVHTLHMKLEMYGDRYSVTPTAWIERFQDETGKFYEDNSNNLEQWRSGYDGTRYWIVGWHYGGIPWRVQDPKPKELRAPAQIGVIRDFIVSSKMTEVLGSSMVGDSKAIVVRAVADNGDSTLYYFDGNTGLLIRRDVPVRVHRSDYGSTTQGKSTDDWAFLDSCFIKQYQPEPASHILFARETECKAMDITRIYRVTRIQTNIPIDDKKFQEP